MVENRIPLKIDPSLFVPKIMFLTKGKGIHKDYLTSFELALREADIADLNLVSVSSIKPPQCKIVSKQEGRKYLMPGQIVFAVMARSSTNEPNRLIAASIGLARPVDDTRHGYLSEHHSFGETAQKAGDYAEDMAMEMLATTWACLTIYHLHGIREKNSGDFQKKFTKHKILHNLQKDIKMDCGPL